MKRYNITRSWEYRASYNGEWVSFTEAQVIEQERDALKAEVAALKAQPKVLNAEEVKETGAYWWSRSGACNRVLVLVYRPDGCALRMRFFLNGSDLLLNGQFIGPIQMPEA